MHISVFVVHFVLGHMLEVFLTLCVLFGTVYCHIVFTLIAYLFRINYQRQRFTIATIVKDTVVTDGMNRHRLTPYNAAYSLNWRYEVSGSNSTETYFSKQLVLLELTVTSTTI